MNLREIILKSDFDSSVDDLYNDFYSRVLRASSSYNRLGGFFSSEMLSLCAQGLQEFIKNNGRMKLILTPKFSEEDIRSIRDGVLTPEKYMDQKWIADFDMIKDKFQSDHVRALAWMLANNYLEIRIALIKDRDGTLLDFNKIKAEGILDQQLGFFSDDDGNSLSFRGSIGSLDNQKLRIFKGWIDGQEDYVETDNKVIKKFWELDTEKFDDGEYISDRLVSVIPLTKAVREKFLEYAPENKEEIRLIRPPKLFEYQLQAVNNWLSNNCKGIFEMATGTGKTFTAIGCIEAVKSSVKPLVIVIACPYINLIYQWKEEVAKWGYKSLDSLGRKQKWLSMLSSKVMDLEYGIAEGPLILVTTYDTFSSRDFQVFISNIPLPIMLIADEVHAAGANQRRLGLTEKFKYRLGLSATPERYFDDDGTKTLHNYFDGVVFELSLAKAIKEGFLCEYEYYPYFVGLTQEELRSYRKLTQKIARLWNDSAASSDKKQSLLELYIFQRTRIVTNAEEKIIKFKEIVEEQKHLAYCLVYCSELQMNEVQRILDSKLISNHRITADIPKKPEERVRYLELFESGLYDVIVAIKVLDEGLNIPAVKDAIILASTGNPRQYIQRRGRVLRKYNSRYKDGSTKDFARIFDVLVIPGISKDDRIMYDLERSIVIKEIVRYEEMAKLSRNSEFGYEQLRSIKKMYEL